MITDDMRAGELRVLPATRRWLAQSGVRFSRAYAPTPLCCPARATILTGKYAHNTGVFDNTKRGRFPGGFRAFDDSPTLATRLDEAGFKTGYIGKYLNNYHSHYLPPGWAAWRVGVNGEYRYRGATVYNMNGRYVRKRGYETTVQTRLATRFIRANADRRFFLVLNYLAPHHNVAKAAIRDPLPHQDHAHDFDGHRVPRAAAFNERNMSDKPRFLRPPRLSWATIARIDDLAEARLEALQSVDDGMVRIQNTLRHQRIARKTNVIFVSDNGYLLGEHRRRFEKTFAYEPSARVPLLMAGPSVPVRGVTRSRPVGLHDIAPTVSSWVGLGSMRRADGRPLFGTGSGRRRDILLQGWFDDAPRKSYQGLRTPHGYKYLKYRRGGVELYNLNTDPREVRNVARKPAYASLRRTLAHRLANLRDCAGATCR